MLTIESSNELALDFPYAGPNRGTLVLSIGGGLPGGAAAFLAIAQGQFICSPTCSVMIKADDAPPKIVKGERPSDQSPKVIQFTGDSAWAFLMAGQKANKLLVQTTIYQAGSKILEFDTPGGTLGALPKPEPLAGKPTN